ncbi:MAG: hypothetical protein JOZ57_16900 [Abitibacteriaceae bacterium]|nr:hypothetical protein [Abditibacteriaceae bacterium]
MALSSPHHHRNPDHDSSSGPGVSHASRNGSTLPHPIPSPQAVQKFRHLYQHQFDTELSDDRALDLATRYLQFFFFGITPLAPDSFPPAQSLTADYPLSGPYSVIAPEPPPLS